MTLLGEPSSLYDDVDITLPVQTKTEPQYDVHEFPGDGGNVATGSPGSIGRPRAKDMAHHAMYDGETISGPYGLLEKGPAPGSPEPSVIVRTDDPDTFVCGTVTLPMGAQTHISEGDPLRSRCHIVNYGPGYLVISPYYGTGNPTGVAYTGAGFLLAPNATTDLHSKNDIHVYGDTAALTTFSYVLERYAQ